MGCGNHGSFNQIDNAVRPGARKIFCVKFQKEMEGLDEIPFEGHPLGQKIYDSVSKEAWKMWVEHMKMLMNEYRLNLGTAQAQEFLGLCGSKVEPVLVHEHLHVLHPHLPGFFGNAVVDLLAERMAFERNLVQAFHFLLKLHAKNFARARPDG